MIFHPTNFLVGFLLAIEIDRPQSFLACIIIFYILACKYIYLYVCFILKSSCSCLFPHLCMNFPFLTNDFLLIIVFFIPIFIHTGIFGSFGVIYL